MPENVTVIVTDRILGPFASQSEHEAGVNASKATHSLGVRQAIAFQVPDLLITPTGAVGGRSSKDHWSDYPHVEDWRRNVSGALLSDTAMLQAAKPGGLLQLGKATYSLEDQLEYNSQTILKGHGRTTIIQAANGFPVDKSVIKLKRTSGQPIGWGLRDLTLLPATNGNALHGVELDNTAGGGYLQNFGIENCQIGAVTLQFGGNAFYLNKQVGGTTNLFTSWFRDNIIVGGLYLDGIGDSVGIYGGTYAGTKLAIYMAPVAGAFRQTIWMPNITATGGALHYKGGAPSTSYGELYLALAQLELQAAWTGDATKRSLVVIDSATKVVIDASNFHPWLLTSDGAHCLEAINGAVVTVRGTQRMVAKSSSSFYHFKTDSTSRIIVQDGDIDDNHYENPVSTVVNTPVATGTGTLVTSRIPTDLGTKTTGTLTPSPKDGRRQKVINGGAFTLAPPTIVGDLTLIITNNASSGVINTAGFSHVTGDAFTTISGAKFECGISFADSISVLVVRALPLVAWSATLGGTPAGVSDTSMRNVHSGLVFGGTEVRVRFLAPSTGPLIVDNASIGIRLSGDTTTSVPVELKFGGVSGFNLGAGASLWSDWATLTFTTADELMTTLDFAAGADAYSAALSGANGRYSRGATNAYNLADFPGTVALIADQCAGVNRIETR